MLENYHPNSNIYNELWRQIAEGKLRQGSLTIPKISSQEESIKWSLAIKKLLETKAKESGVPFRDLLDSFRTGAEIFGGHKDFTRLEWALGRVNLLTRISQPNEIKKSYVGGCINRHGEYWLCVGVVDEDLRKAKKDVDDFELYFDFNSMDDLFLSDEDEKNGVCTFV